VALIVRVGKEYHMLELAGVRVVTQLLWLQVLSTDEESSVHCRQQDVCSLVNIFWVYRFPVSI
jgi:hypothetical protein